MKVIFDNFIDFEKEKPQKYESCLFLWQGSCGINVYFGIWNGEAFLDGVGGYYTRNRILKWESIQNCKTTGIFL